MQREIGIIVVSYHNPDMTIRYVTKELPKLATPYTLVVVNVAATQEDSFQLAEACGLCFVDDEGTPTFPDAQRFLIWDKENLGYAKGNNKGAKFLIENFKVDYLLFSNNDIEIIDKDCLSVMIEKMEQNKEIGAIGPRIIGLDGKDQMPHDYPISIYRQIGWMLFPFLRRRKTTENTIEKQDVLKSHFTYWVQGSFLMMRTIDFLNVEMFDSNTFLYAEESIMAERLKKTGKRMYFDSSVKVLHYEGGTIIKENGNSKSRMMAMESNCYYYREYLHYNRLFIALYRWLFMHTNR